MPVTREFTPAEIEEMVNQGVDPKTLPKQAEFYSPEEMQAMKQQQDVEQAGMIKGGIIPTIKSHAGSLVGGGLAGGSAFSATLPWAAAAAPETFGTSLLVPPIAGVVASMIGGKAGDVAQKKLVEPLIGMTPQDQQKEEQAAQMARQVYPKTAIGTDVVGGMLAGGGSPSIKAPIYAAKGILQFAKQGEITTLPYRQAVQNVITGNALNTAINTGVQLATTGKVDPEELAGAAIGGALMSEPSALGKRLNKNWKPLEKMQPEIPDVAENISPDGQNLAEVEANRKLAAGLTQDIQVANQDYIGKRDAITKMQEEQYQREVQQQQTEQQIADQWKKQNWQTKQQDGTPLIGDDLVAKEFVRRNKVDLRKIQLPEQRAIAKQQNDSLGDVPVGDMRQRLFEEDFAKRDPQGWEQYQQQKAQEDQLQVQKLEAIQQAQRDQEARQQQRNADFQRAEEELRQQQLQEAEQARRQREAEQLYQSKSNPQPQQEIVPQSNTLTENQARIINKDSIASEMSKRGLAEPREGGQLFQEPQGQPTTEPVDKNLLKEAAKASTKVGVTSGDELKTNTGAVAAGASYDPKEVGRRLIAIAREHATSDTGYHELTHTMLRDLDRSSDPFHQELAATIRRTLGGEEPAAQHIGEQYQQTVEQAASKGLPWRIAKTFKDIWSNVKIHAGKGTAEDYTNQLVDRMRNRAGKQDVTIAGQTNPGSVGTHYQTGDYERYNELMGQMREALKSKDYDTFHKLQTETEQIKNRNVEHPGMPPTMPKSEGSQFQESRFKPTQAALDRITSDVPDKVSGKLVHDALLKTLVERQSILGKFWNPIGEAASKMKPQEIENVRKVLTKEVNEKIFHRSDLATPQETKLYDVIRKSLRESAELRQKYGEPVYRDGKPTPAGIDPYYYPTTTEPKVADIFRQNTNKDAIKKLSDDFIDHQIKHGFNKHAAEQNLRDKIQTFQGNAKFGNSNETFYNANRKAQGIPLPESWQRTNMLRNLEAYHRRGAVDIAWYHNVEMDHPTMAALGYQKDPWNNPVSEPHISNLSNNSAVEATTDTLKGEHMGTAERVARAAETFATVTMLGPATEVHKIFSSVFKSISEYAENPVESARILTAGTKGMMDAWKDGFKKIHDTGYVQYDAKKASDFLNTHLTMAERLQGLNKSIRQVYTLGNLTENFTKAFLHSAGEYLIPTKIAAAEAGNAKATTFLTRLDPDYRVGTRYSPEQMQTLASEVANQIHGTKDARTLPSWMLHDNEISAFFKLSSWNIAQTNNFMRNVYTPAKHGDYGPLLMSAFGASVGGYLIKELREKLTSKKSGIPTLTDIANSEGGFGQNKAALAYNWMAASSFAGFAGILSVVGRLPFDMAFKNIPQGATFPLDEVVGNTALIVKNAGEALMNDPDANITDISGHVLLDLAKNNIQLARITFNHMADAGLIDSAAYKKALSDKEGQLRRFKMVNDMPFEPQSGAEGNPYMNLAQKEFKREQDPQQAMKELPPLINTIINRWGNNPEVMLEKFKGLKQNGYETMPSLDDTPIAFMRYLRFLSNSEGPDKATAMMQDYLQHRMVNQMKAGMVP